MRFVLFYHSLISDWNHGNAHFLRGVVRELQSRGHTVSVYEPRQGWSLKNLREQHGDVPIDTFNAAYPTLRSQFYDLETLDVDRALEDADAVIVHEWNEPELVRRIGECRDRGGRFRLFFHDTHHRAVSDPNAIRALRLDHYDGVLAFGEVLRQIYEDRNWCARAWTWHEAADVRIFKPLTEADSDDRRLDLVWVGNWGEGERVEEISRFLIEPVKALNLKARVHGVRYPQAALQTLADAGVDYRGWLPNFRAPGVFATAKTTVHIPRRYYAETLPGIPTIRMFEALACGIPLVSAPWDDCENLFEPGRDYLVARDGEEMREHLRRLCASPEERKALASAGLSRILERHTCAHRVNELLAICESLSDAPRRKPRPTAAPHSPQPYVPAAEAL